jgi:hypothetical protein
VQLFYLGELGWERKNKTDMKKKEKIIQPHLISSASIPSRLCDQLKSIQFRPSIPHARIVLPSLKMGNSVYVFLPIVEHVSRLKGGKGEEKRGVEEGRNE